MKRPIIFDSDLKAVRSISPSPNGTTDYVEDRSSESFVEALSSLVPIDTGLMPPGVISIRQGGIYQQIVVVVPPGIYPTIWGAREHDVSAKTYHLAQPYRVIVGEFQNNSFLGCRTFFSPTSIFDEDAVMHHVNMPNINCKGYNGTGVGWVCLYHTGDTTNMTFAQKAAYIGLRCSGNEAANDGNMSRTDGPRFYRSMGKPDFLVSPTEWDKKSEKEGFEWTLDPDMWIPILTDTEQQKHIAGGKPLTLGQVMRGNAAFYYPGRAPNPPRPFNMDSKVVYGGTGAYDNILAPAWAKATRVKVTEVDRPKDAPPAKKTAIVKRA